jgi:hypothetical protein
LRRQHCGRLLAASAAKSGAASERPRSNTIVMESARRIFTLRIREERFAALS